MESLEVNNFGPIEKAKVNFGDLTFVVGPQASGKSLFLELLKYLLDKDFVLSDLKRYNYVVENNNPKKILDLFFGEGMNEVFRENTEIFLNGEKQAINTLLTFSKENQETEQLFYIPAQRILSISDGRPKNFMEFDVATPYVLRSFSETLRLYLQGGIGNAVIFPAGKRLKEALLTSFDENIFHGGKIVMEEIAGLRKLKMRIDNASIPFMTWSAGQKEFMPLLLAFYYLSSGDGHKLMKRGEHKYVVIEEPEMGLHPQAIKSVILEILDLIHNGMKVIVSTHSTTLLDFAWAFNIIKKSSRDNKVEAFYEMFDIAKDASNEHLFDELLEKKVSTVYFSRNGKYVTSTDISSLDAGDENLDVSEWGGLSWFASKAAEIVFKYSE